MHMYLVTETHEPERAVPPTSPQTGAAPSVRDATPTGTVVPFPTARCHRLVQRIVASGDNDYLAKHQSRLEALGVDPALNEADTTALANAMRSYWMEQRGRKATA